MILRCLNLMLLALGVQYLMDPGDDGIIEMKMEVVYKDIKLLRFINVFLQGNKYEIEFKCKLDLDIQQDRKILRTESELQWLLDHLTASAAQLAVLPKLKSKSYLSYLADMLARKNAEDELSFSKLFMEHTVKRFLTIIAKICLPFMGSPHERSVHPLFLFINERFSLYVNGSFFAEERKMTSWFGSMQSKLSMYFTNTATQTKELQTCRLGIDILLRSLQRFEFELQKYLQKLSAMSKQFIEGSENIRKKINRLQILHYRIGNNLKNLELILEEIEEIAKKASQKDANFVDLPAQIKAYSEFVINESETIKKESGGLLCNYAKILDQKCQVAVYPSRKA